MRKTPSKKKSTRRPQEDRSANNGGRDSSSRVTMPQIAARAGVSLGTVSHVINETAPVREGLRERVLEAIKGLGYRPNQLSRGLRRNRTNMIGMIIPDITNPFFPAVVRGVEDAAYKRSYRLMLCNADNDRGKEITYFDDLKSFLPAGLLVIPSADTAISAQSAGVPIVCIDRQPSGWGTDSVTVANSEGAYKAAQYLIKMGHRRIGVIAGPSHLANAQERLNGFLKALKEANIPISPEYVQEASFDRPSGHIAAVRLLQLLPRPTAIFVSNDLMALGALSAVHECQLACPSDVSLVSFDALDFTEHTYPALTSVYQPGYQMGYTAACMLLDRIEGFDGPARHVVLDTELRIRNSVSACRDRARDQKPRKPGT